MGSNPPTDPRRPNDQSTERTTTNSQGGPVVAGTASMFNHAHGNHFTNSQFHVKSYTTNLNTTNDPLAVVHNRVASNAILNAGGRADEPRCHPGTRTEVIGRIEKWRSSQDSQTPPIFWLSGPAGAGKSAIVQTIAKRSNEREVPQANFFFFRTDASRNSLSPLIATLVHQIILLYPPLKESVTAVLSNNPLIFASVLEDQLMQLVVTPLENFKAAQLSASKSYVPPLLLIDGLDECESDEKRSQRQILHSFDKVLASHPRLFYLLIASRDEPQIRAAFGSISCQLLSLYLDDQYFPERDIRAFVNDEFERIRKTHALAKSLDATWPSVEVIEEIVKKSSGQFIYAATVMRFISDSDEAPTRSLKQVHGAAPIFLNSEFPFAYLDAIYAYILSRVKARETLMDILHAHFLIEDASKSIYRKRRTSTLYLNRLLEAYSPDYTEEMILSCLVKLSSIARYERVPGVHSRVEYQLLFYHASFPDYLRDKSRSGDYFVDIDAFNIKILPSVWKGLELPRKPGRGLEIVAYPGLCRLQKLPPGFLDTLIELEPRHFGHLVDYVVGIADIFKPIYNLCAQSDDDMANYKRLVRQWSYAFGNDSITQETDDSKWPPCSQRYRAMAHIDRHITTEPCGHIELALRPETEFDAREIAEWLCSLLHRIHRENSLDNAQEHNLRLQQWMTWAAQNNVPLDGLDDLPMITCT